MRASSRSRPGSFARIACVASACAFISFCTSGSAVSSRKRYGSSTCVPQKVSVTTRGGGGAGTSTPAKVAANAGAAASRAGIRRRGIGMYRRSKLRIIPEPELLLPLRTTETGDPQGAEDSHALVALVDGAHAGAVVLRARDLGGAVRLDVQRARDRDVGTEAVPALGIVQADRALAGDVHRRAHEDKRGLVGGRVVAGLRRADAEDLHAGRDHAGGGRALPERRLRAPRGDAAVQGLLFRGGLRAGRGAEEDGGECGTIHGLTPCVVDGAARGSRAARWSSHRSTPRPRARRAGSPPRAAWSR